MTQVSSFFQLAEEQIFVFIGINYGNIIYLDRSEEAKAHSKKVLEEEFGGGEGVGGHQGAEARSEKNKGNVVGGLRG